MNGNMVRKIKTFKTINGVKKKMLQTTLHCWNVAQYSQTISRDNILSPGQRFRTMMMMMMMSQTALHPEGNYLLEQSEDELDPTSRLLKNPSMRSKHQHLKRKRKENTFLMKKTFLWKYLDKKCPWEEFGRLGIICDPHGYWQSHREHLLTHIVVIPSFDILLSVISPGMFRIDRQLQYFIWNVTCKMLPELVYQKILNKNLLISDWVLRLFTRRCRDALLFQMMQSNEGFHLMFILCKGSWSFHPLAICPQLVHPTLPVRPMLFTGLPRKTYQ